MRLFLTICAVLTVCAGEPPSNNQGWGQQQQQGGYDQSQQQQGGWGQQQSQQQQGGWGASQQQEQQGGWGQSQGQKGGVNYEWNFALGYQGQNEGQGNQGWGQQQQQQQQQQQMMSGGWSSEPETNVNTPSIREIFKSIISFPGQLIMLFRESGLWILFLPLIVIIPLFLLAFSAGKFFGGLETEGWGWDKRSKAAFLEKEWNSLVGFLKDPKVQRAAKGFMDEFVADRIMKSVHKSVSEQKVSKSKKVRRR